MILALGGTGYTEECRRSASSADAKPREIGAGTNEIRRVLIGREVLGA